MKKSIIFLIVVLTVLTLCLCACNDPSGEMRNINSLLRDEYSKMNVTVSTEYQGYTLLDTYDLVTSDGKTNITYEIMRFNSFEESNGNVSAPDEIVTKRKGSAVVENGKLVSVNGDPITAVELDSLNLNMSLKLPYFENIKTPNNTFSADVVNPQGFLGVDSFDGTDLHVVIRYTESSISRIKLEYVGSSGSTVTISYVLNN